MAQNPVHALRRETGGAVSLENAVGGLQGELEVLSSIPNPSEGSSKRPFRELTISPVGGPMVA